MWNVQKGKEKKLFCICNRNWINLFESVEFFFVKKKKKKILKLSLRFHRSKNIKDPPTYRRVTFPFNGIVFWIVFACPEYRFNKESSLITGMPRNECPINSNPNRLDTDRLWTRHTSKLARRGRIDSSSRWLEGVIIVVACVQPRRDRIRSRWEGDCLIEPTWTIVSLLLATKGFLDDFTITFFLRFQRWWIDCYTWTGITRGTNNYLGYKRG